MMMSEETSSSRLVYLFLVTLCAASYWSALDCKLVFDDISAIRDNRDIRPHSSWFQIFSNDFWGTPMLSERSHKSYRPLTVLTFKANYALHKLEPLGYHFGNFVLHILVTLLYARFCCLLTGNSVGHVAAILFAVHPIHTEAVTGIVGRAELLAAVFYLLALLTYFKFTSRRLNSASWLQFFTSIFFVVLSMFCKEQGITCLAVCASLEIFFMITPQFQTWKIAFWKQIVPPKSASWLTSHRTHRLCVLAGSGLILLILRLRIMGSQLPIFTSFDNPAANADWPTRPMTFNYLLYVNIWLLISACDLCCDWTMNTIPLVDSILDVRNIFTLFFYAFMALLIRSALVSKNKNHSLVLVFSISTMIFSFLPASNFFFHVGFVVAERVLYIPSMGFSLLVAYGWRKLDRKRRTLSGPATISKILLSLFIILHLLRTHIRNWDWKNEYSIFTSGLKVNKENAKLFNNVGHSLEERGQYIEALKYFQHAVGMQPDDIGAHINVGRTYNNLEKYDYAEKAYIKAKELLPRVRMGETYHTRIDPNHLNVFLNLATLIAKNRSRLEEADLLYRQAISMRADYTQAYINRGDVLIKLNRTKEAQAVYERALTYDDTNADLYYNLGVVFLEQGQHERAMTYLDKALQYDPDHPQALLNSAILIQELGGNFERRSVGISRLLRIVSSDSAPNEKVFFNLGMLYMDNADIGSAEQWFRKSVQVKPDFRSALFNLALLLSESGRAMESAPYLQQLRHYHPNHIKGLILLGDLYVNQLRDLKAAEECYRHILRLDPNNVQGLHNLCVVMVESGDLLRAKNCLQEARRLAPDQDYILKHLQIVENRLNVALNRINKASQIDSESKGKRFFMSKQSSTHALDDVYHSKPDFVNN